MWGEDRSRDPIENPNFHKKSVDSAFFGLKHQNVTTLDCSREGSKPGIRSSGHGRLMQIGLHEVILSKSKIGSIYRSFQESKYGIFHDDDGYDSHRLSRQANMGDLEAMESQCGLHKGMFSLFLPDSTRKKTRWAHLVFWTIL